MNRLLLLGNAFLALLLVFAWADLAVRRAELATAHGAEVKAADRRSPATLPPESMRLLCTDPLRPRRLLLDFGTAMTRRLDAGTADLGLVLEPATDFAARWQTPRQLLLVAERPLARATRYHVEATRDLTALDGRVVRAGTLLWCETAPVSRLDVTVDDSGASGVELLLGFDLPVDVASLRPRLALRTEEGRALRYRLEPVRADDRRVFRLRPAAGDLAAVTLAVGAGLRALHGDVPTGSELGQRVTWSEQLELLGMSARDGRVLLQLDHTVPLPDPATFRLTPSVPVQLVKDHRGVELVGDFAPGRPITVELLAGFPGSGRHRLPAAVRRSVLIPDRRAEIAFAQAGSVLSALALPQLDVDTTNVRRLRVALRHAYGNNVVRLVQDGREAGEVFAPPVEKELPVAAVANERIRTTIDLASLLGSAPRGLWDVELADADHRASARHRLLQVTDLGVTMRCAGRAIAVSAISLAHGTPAAGAELAVLTPTNQLLVRGVTAADGTAVLHYDAGTADRRPFLLRVTAGDDTAYVDVRTHRTELSSGALGGRPFVCGVAEASVDFSRGIVRPGERIEATVLVRDAGGTAPVGLPLELVWLGPDQRVWQRRSTELDGSGLCSAELQTDGAAPTGRWQLEVRAAADGSVLGAGRFTVDAFVPDRLEAEVALKAPLHMGERGAIEVRASWLDGAPAAGRPVILRARFDGVPFAVGGAVPDGLESFSFGRDTGLWSDPTPAPGAVPPLRGVLDDDGVAVLRLPLPFAQGDPMLRADLRVEVLDPSGRPVHARLLAPVHRPDWYLGVRAGARGAAQVVAVDASGKPVAEPAEVELQLERRSFEWQRVRGRHGWHYRTKVHAELLARRTVELDHGHARGQFDVSPPEAGSWLVVVARAGDRAVEQALGGKPLRPDRLRVHAAGPAAAGGDAVLAVDAPAGGRGFLVLEGPTIVGTSVVELARGHSTLRVPLPADLALPNVHAILTLTRPLADGDRDGPFWLVGGTSIALQRDDLRTAVTVETPGELRPEQELEVGVTAPGALAATVAVVDEGVLQITGHRDPDPLAFFLAARRDETIGADTGPSLLESVKFAPGVKSGGDGIGNDRLRGSISTAIRPLALFSDVLQLDEKGRGHCRFRLPPYQGRLRVMVIASGPHCMGAASRSVPVRSPLGVRIAMPRMVVPGDRFEVPLTVSNDTATPAVVRLELATTDGLVLEGEEDRELPLAAHQQHTLTLGLLAGGVAPGGAHQELSVRASTADERRRIHGAVEVRTPSAFADQLLGVAFGEQATALRIAGDWRDDDLQVELRLDCNPESQLLPALEAMLDYPHGCIEQTTSRCSALLSCSGLLERLAPERASRARAMLADGIGRIFSMQTADGGFGWWPDDRDTYPFGTIHTVDFLLAARDAGVAVPENALGRALHCVERLAAGQGSAALRCCAVEVLSRSDRPVQPWLDRLAETASGAEDRVRLAIAAARIGLTERATTLLAAPAEAPLGRETGGLLRSPLRFLALRLRALRLAVPAARELPELARDLARAILEPSATTTQEKAQVLRALAAYYAVRSDDDDPLVGRVSVGGHSFDLEPGIALRLPARAGDTLELAANRTAYGLLHVRGRRQLAGAPAAAPPGAAAPPPAAALALERSFIDTDTGKPAERLRRGRLYEVRLSGTLPVGLDNFLLTDLLPGGVELDPPQRGVAEAFEHAAADPSELEPSHVERRDDRVLLFFEHGAQNDGEVEITYRVRATFPGRYALPGLLLEPLYRPGAVLRQPGGGMLEVTP